MKTKGIKRAKSVTVGKLSEGVKQETSSSSVFASNLSNSSSSLPSSKMRHCASDRVTSCRTIIYPGTFDPITNGHIDLIARAARLFDKIIIAIALSEKKNGLFTLKERHHMVTATIKNLVNANAGSNVDVNSCKLCSFEVCSFSGLLIDLVREQKVFNILRGLRTPSDFEYELQLTGLYHQLEPRVEIVFLTPTIEHLYLSASMVREIAMLGGDVSRFVTREVKAALQQKFNAAKKLKV